MIIFGDIKENKVQILKGLNTSFLNSYEHPNINKTKLEERVIFSDSKSHEFLELHHYVQDTRNLIEEIENNKINQAYQNFQKKEFSKLIEQPFYLGKLTTESEIGQEISPIVLVPNLNINLDIAKIKIKQWSREYKQINKYNITY